MCPGDVPIRGRAPIASAKKQSMNMPLSQAHVDCITINPEQMANSWVVFSPKLPVLRSIWPFQLCTLGLGSGLFRVPMGIGF